MRHDGKKPSTKPQVVRTMLRWRTPPLAMSICPVAMWKTMLPECLFVLLIDMFTATFVLMMVVITAHHSGMRDNRFHGFSVTSTEAHTCMYACTTWHNCVLCLNELVCVCEAVTWAHEVFANCFESSQIIFQQVVHDHVNQIFPLAEWLHAVTQRHKKTHTHTQKLTSLPLSLSLLLTSNYSFNLTHMSVIQFLTACPEGCHLAKSGDDVVIKLVAGLLMDLMEGEKEHAPFASCARPCWFVNRKEPTEKPCLLGGQLRPQRRQQPDEGAD